MNPTLRTLIENFAGLIPERPLDEMAPISPKLMMQVVSLTSTELQELHAAFHVGLMEMDALARAAGDRARAEGYTLDSPDLDKLIRRSYPLDLERELCAVMLILRVHDPDILNTLIPQGVRFHAG